MLYYLKTKHQIVADSDLKTLLDFLKEKYGLLLQEHQFQRLKDYLNVACESYHYQTVHALIEDLIQGKLEKKSMDAFFDAVTVSESYFFRDEPQMTFLREVFLKKLIEKKRKEACRKIRIWSAGCAGGQEIYSLIILLKEMLPDFSEWDLIFLATDLNPKAIEYAKSGEFTAHHLHQTNDRVKVKFFEKKGNTFLLSNSIIQLARFQIDNLSASTVFAIDNGFDLILCRNVFIYMSKTCIEQALLHFRMLLNPEGMIMLGASDFVHEDIPGLRHVGQGQVFYYELSKKQSNLEKSSPVKPLVFDNKVAEATLQQTEQEKIKYLYANDRCEEAFQCVQTILNKEELDPVYYLMGGLLKFELGDMLVAEKLLKQALFLDKNRVETLFALGQVSLKQGALSRAKKWLEAAYQESLAQKSKHYACTGVLSGTNFARELEAIYQKVHKD